MAAKRRRFVHFDWTKLRELGFQYKIILTLLHEMPLFSHHTHSHCIVALLDVKHTDTVTL